MGNAIYSGLWLGQVVLPDRSKYILCKMFSLVLMVDSIDTWKHSIQHSMAKNVCNTAHAVSISKVCEHGEI